MDVEVARSHIERVRAEERRVGRATPLEISITPPGRLTADRRDAYRAIGVDRLIPMLPQSGEHDALAAIDSLAALDG
jgi:hypothetical protein